MKVILSRKGFDSAAGGYPSPLLIDEGLHISLPIPEDNAGNIIDTGITYNDLLFDENMTYAELMEELNIKGFHNRYAHLDPDINHKVVKNREANWKGIFGQCSAAQSHLNNQKVQEGDLFLFFGWFKEVKKINNKYQFIKGTDKQVIWGYLQVEEAQSISKDKQYESWKLAHPHYHYRERDKNTAYIAKEKLSFNDTIPGFGCLKYNPSLVLTCHGQSNKSLWKLPHFFHPQHGTKMTYHEKLITDSGTPVWQLMEDYCLLQSVGRGQEFVISGNKKVEKWAEALILEGCK